MDLAFLGAEAFVVVYVFAADFGEECGSHAGLLGCLLEGNKEVGDRGVGVEKRIHTQHAGTLAARASQSVAAVEAANRLPLRRRRVWSCILFWDMKLIMWEDG